VERSDWFRDTESPEAVGSVRSLRASLATLAPVLASPAFAHSLAPFSPIRYRLVNRTRVD